MQIESIDHTSRHLAAVKTLGRANAGTLGHLPEGAFDDHAQRGHILVALDDQRRCVGYLLYRISHGWATIVHLCVDAQSRCGGVARCLVDRLCMDTQHLIGIRADCRRDYAINVIWPRLGFRAAGERPGRSRAGSVLTRWLLDHGHPDLFTVGMMERLESKLLVAIDANIFYDLHDPARPDREESLALLADWLQAEIELAVSDELWNEIHRGSDERQRQRARAAAETFTRFPTDRVAFDAAQRSLRQLFPAQMTPNDESDLRQLARAIAGEVPFFVTRDTGLLERAEAVYQTHGIAIRRPSDLIIHLDELRRQQEYQPARLAGTSIELRRVQSQEQRSLAAHFQHDAQGESRADFERLLRRVLATPMTIECLLALDEAQTPLLLIAYDRSHPDRLTIPLLRVRRGVLAPTLARYIVLAMVARSAREGRQITRVTDPALDELLTGVLQQDAFVLLADGAWGKLHLALADTAAAIATALRALAAADPTITAYACHLADSLDTVEVVSDSAASAELERVLWPTKTIDAALPTFLIPIQPQWAQELFDEDLANQTLFGAAKLLPLNREAIYYRAKRPQVVSVPGRILWYVSQDRYGRHQGGSAVRACSRLDEVVIGLPKDLYRRFQRLGIYEWRHVLAAAHGDINQSIMALRFSHTELFRRSIPMPELRAIYAEAGCGLMLQGPSRLPTPQLFARLYRRGMALSNDSEAH